MPRTERNPGQHLTAPTPRPAGTQAGRVPSVSRMSTRWRLLELLIITAVAFSAVLLYRTTAGPGYPLDDSWIHLAFARNLAAGHIFQINPGEPSPGATSPLWVILLSTGFLLGAGPDVWPWLLGAAMLAACGVLAARFCADLLADHTRPHKAGKCADPPPVWWQRIGALCAGLATVTAFPLVWSAAGAMEPALFALLLLASLRAALQSRLGGWRHTLAWGIWAGFAVNARPEGLLAIPLLAAVELAGGLRRWRRALVGTALALLLALPYSLFCLHASGRWFANTFYAKTVGTAAHWPDFAYLGQMLTLLGNIAPEVLVLLVPALVAIAFWRLRPQGAAALAAVLFVVGLALAYACMQRSFLFAGIGNFGRYLYPVIPLLLAVGSAAVLRAAASLGASGGRVALVLAAILLLTTGVRLFNRARFFAHSVSDINRMQLEMASALRDALPPGSLVAANDIGVLAYRGELRVLDLVGIVSTDVLNAVRPVSHAAPGAPAAGEPPELALARVLATRRPSAIVVFPTWYRTVLTWLSPGLSGLKQIRVPDNITSGGDTMVAFGIDWSRVPPLPDRGAPATATATRPAP